MSATARITTTSSAAAESARVFNLRDEKAELTAEQEEAEYESFTKAETERILKEEVRVYLGASRFISPHPLPPPSPPPQALEVEKATKDNTKKSIDTAFSGALVAIDRAIDSAQKYSERMNSMEGLKFTDVMLQIEGQPPAITGILRDYQLVGFQWIARRAFSGESVILADEMGLGEWNFSRNAIANQKLARSSGEECSDKWRGFALPRFWDHGAPREAKRSEAKRSEAKRSDPWLGLGRPLPRASRSLCVLLAYALRLTPYAAHPPPPRQNNSSHLLHRMDATN